MDTSQKFRQSLSLWLASHGVSVEQCEEILNHRRMQLCLKMQDPGGVTMDLPEVLARIDGAREAYSASRTAEGRFELLMVLREGAQKTVPRPRAATSRPAPPRPTTVKTYELTVLNKDDSWQVLLGKSLRPLSAEQVRFLASRGAVRCCALWTRDHAEFQVSLLRSSMPAIFAELEKSSGLRRASDMTLDVRRTERVPGMDERANHFELTFVLDTGAYLQFFDKLAAVAA